MVTGHSCLSNMPELSIGYENLDIFNYNPLASLYTCQGSKIGNIQSSDQWPMDSGHLSIVNSPYLIKISSN